MNDQLRKSPMSLADIAPHWPPLPERLLWAAAGAFMLYSSAALAYVDPNAAGFLYQIFFPLMVAVVGAWRWIKTGASTVKQKIFRKPE
jgi:hypothetical protein